MHKAYQLIEMGQGITQAMTGLDKRLTAKLVYYGQALAGKITCLTRPHDLSWQAVIAAAREAP